MKRVLRFVFILFLGLGNMVIKFICGDNDHADDGDCGDEGDGFGFVACSICLKTVVKDVVLY